MALTGGYCEIQLEEYGINVERTKDGKENLDIFGNNIDKFDLILMDVRMLNMNGHKSKPINMDDINQTIARNVKI